MNTATRSLPHRAEVTTAQAPAVPDAQALSVRAEYVLSEAGRKAFLLAGGDGRARQQITLSVPLTRLHLVAVSVDGVARLKLHPRFELADDQRVLRRDTPPTYDAPPTLDDLFRDAARNYELERTYHSQRSTVEGRRRDKGQDIRSQVAEDFFADTTQRAMTFPVPSPRRCFIATPRGRVMFDRVKDSGLARELPKEAHRRFRADLQAEAEQRRQAHAAQTAVWEAKNRAVDEWVAAHGTAEQQARHAAGLLPMREVVAAFTDEAFVCLDDKPRYALDGASLLQAHLREKTGRADLVVSQADLRVVGEDADSATAAQWDVIRRLQAAVPESTVTLRAHRLSWRREPEGPSLTVFGVLVTLKVGPFVVRREFAVPAR
jgi:hypothetical protein